MPHTSDPPSRGAYIRAIVVEQQRVWGATPARADALQWLHDTFGITAEDEAFCSAILGYHVGQLSAAEYENPRLMAALADEARVCAFLDELLGKFQSSTATYPGAAPRDAA